jgi:hypothetical protein
MLTAQNEAAERVAPSPPLGQHGRRNRYADAGAPPRPMPCNESFHPMISRAATPVVIAIIQRCGCILPDLIAVDTEQRNQSSRAVMDDLRTMIEIGGLWRGIIKLIPCLGSLVSSCGQGFPMIR